MFGEGARKHRENNQWEETNPQRRNGQVRILGGTTIFVFSRQGLVFTASPCIAWQVARDLWHLLEKTRLRFHRRKRNVPSKARPTMLAFPSNTTTKIPPKARGAEGCDAGRSRLYVEAMPFHTTKHVHAAESTFSFFFCITKAESIYYFIHCVPQRRKEGILTKKKKRSRQTSCLAIIRFSPFSLQWQYKGNNERTKNKEIFTRTWVWGLVLRVCVCAVCVCEMFVWLLVHVSTNFYGGCVRCVRWNNVRLVTNDFCLHNTGFKTLIYTASKTFRWFFVLALVSTEKSPTS